jgi:hypothetical protein
MCMYKSQAHQSFDILVETSRRVLRKQLKPIAPLFSAQTPLAYCVCVFGTYWCCFWKVIKLLFRLQDVGKTCVNLKID